MDVILSHNFIIDFLTNKKIHPKAKIYPLLSNSNFVLFCHENIKKTHLILQQNCKMAENLISMYC